MHASDDRLPELVPSCTLQLLMYLHAGEALSIRAEAQPGVNIEGGQDIQDTHRQPGHRDSRGAGRGGQGQ